MRTDLNISTTNTDGAKKTSKLSYVNPNANDGELSTLVNKIAEFSNDTLTAATRTDTTDIPTTYTPVYAVFEREAPTDDSTYTKESVEYIIASGGTTGIDIKTTDANKEEQPYMLYLEPYVKQNNTRVMVSAYKDSTSEAYAIIALAVIGGVYPEDETERNRLTPSMEGDIIIGFKSVNSNYVHVGKDLTIRIREHEN